MLRSALSLSYPEEVAALAPLLSPAASTATTICDNDRLAEAAAFHGVVGHVIEAVARRELTLTRDVRKQLSLQWMIDTAQASQVRDQLTEIAPVLDDACGVPPILVKGPAVADGYYQNSELRSFGDLDLIVPRNRLEAAARALQAAFGYRREPEPWPGYAERHGHHIGLVRPFRRWAVSVDLHWRIGDDPVAERLDHQRLLERCHARSTRGGSILVPGLEDHLVLLTVHLLHERDKRLIWLNDIALLAGAASPGQWDAVFAVARELELGWVLHRGLDYVARHLGMNRERPSRPGSPPRWGPLRATETFDGWVGMQIGQLAVGGLRERDGYLRSATRARARQLRDALNRACL